MSTDKNQGLKDQFEKDQPPAHCLDGARPLSKDEHEAQSQNVPQATADGEGTKYVYKPGGAF